MRHRRFTVLLVSESTGVATGCCRFVKKASFDSLTQAAGYVLAYQECYPSNRYVIEPEVTDREE